MGSTESLTYNTAKAITRSFIDAKSKDVMINRYHTALTQSSLAGDVRRIENLMIEMRLKGIAPTQTTYSFLVAAHAKNKNSLRAEQAVDEARLLGLSITSRILSPLIHAFANSGNPDSAEKVLKDAIATGIVPGRTAFNRLTQPGTRIVYPPYSRVVSLLIKW